MKDSMTESKTTEWRPVETAPMDGGNYLVAVPFPECNDYLIYIAHGCDGVWLCEEIEEEINPTHWMPLPDTPND